MWRWLALRAVIVLVIVVPHPSVNAVVPPPTRNSKISSGAYSEVGNFCTDDRGKFLASFGEDNAWKFILVRKHRDFFKLGTDWEFNDESGRRFSGPQDSMMFVS